MSFLDKNSRRNINTVLLRAAIIVGTVLLILCFMPRKTGPTYEYEIGKPWKYGSLIAQYDFGIQKSQEALKAEEDSLMRSFEPYFTLGKDTEGKMVDKFMKDNPRGIEGLPRSYIYTIASVLHNLYQKGIMETTRYDQMVRDSVHNIRVIADKMAIGLSLDSIRTTRSAYLQLFENEQLLAQRQQLQRCNLNEYIVPNLLYDEERTLSAREDVLRHISVLTGAVFKGQKIIDRGEIVDDKAYRILESLRAETEQRSSITAYYMTFAGQALYISTLLIIFMVYVSLFRRDFYESVRTLLMLYLLTAIFPILVSLMIEYNWFNIYILPYCITPIFVRVFMDSRTAFITHVMSILISACAVHYQYEFVVVQLVSGLVAIYGLRELSSRSQIIKTAIFVTLTAMAVYLAFELMDDDELSKLNERMYINFCISGVALLFAYPFMYLIERAFGFTSDVTLVELSNTNTPLLRKMSEIAPGTFQHSIQVSNLAAEIANRIGAKGQLARCGALYHDIGKLANPAFFTENHAAQNPHDNLSFMDSAKIITSHVSEGLRLADKYDLPSSIREFITTHHGTGMARYFYVSYKNQHPDEDVDTAPFSYPGPNPFTREQACLMMADTVEAASRSLKEYTEDSISRLVNNLIDRQVEDGCFRECPITFRDVFLAKQVLIDKLMTMYHTRIQYPELNSK